MLFRGDKQGGAHIIRGLKHQYARSVRFEDSLKLYSWIVG